MKIVIVGGVAGGASAAARIRRLDEQAEIIIFEKSGFISYANCGLPYYIGDVITEQSELTLQTAKGFWSRFRIQVKTRHEVTAINVQAKTVKVKNLETGEEWEESYDKLVLSPGATPTRPQLPGIDSKKIFTLRTVEDTLQIHEYINAESPKSAVIVGGGYIGIELAENLREKGMDITIVEAQQQLMNILDYDMAAFVHGKIRQKGVDLWLGRTVTGFREEDGKIVTLIEGEDGIAADIVLLAVGVTPDSRLAKEAGLELGIKGSIVVNDRMETSAPDVFAVGDAVQVKHMITGADTVIPLAGPANKQGRIAADNICGGDSHYQGSLGSSIIKVFDLAVASTGLTVKAATEAGFDVERVVLSPSSHASYYPGSKVMTMKVVFERSTCRLLGAQIIGSEGVDKRLDVLATSIFAGLTGDQLKDLDLSYAPPFSSAKDPVNMAGFMIENIKNGIVKQFHWDEVSALPRDGSVTLLDTRTPGEYNAGYIEGFINIPVDDLREHLDEIDKTKPVYVNCQSALRSYIACRILSQNGFDCYNLSGGYRFYSAVVQEQELAESTFPCGMDRK